MLGEQAEARAARRRRLLRWLKSRFSWIALAGALAGLAFTLWSQRGAVRRFDWQLSWPSFLLAVALFAAAPLVQGSSFWLILRLLGLRSRPGATLVVWMRSFLLRYAPSGALGLAYRVRERDRLEATAAHPWTAAAYEQLASLASGSLACVAAFLLARVRPPVAADVAAALAVVIAVAARPGFAGAYVQGRLRARGVDVPALLRGRWLAAVIAVNALAWLATGAGAYALVAALDSGSTPRFFTIVGIYAFAWLVGFVVPLLPGGLGARDATLAALLAVPFTTGVAAALAVILRFANTVGELAAAGLVEGGSRVRR